jgi:hypothetical protein
MDDGGERPSDLGALHIWSIAAELRERTEPTVLTEV